MQITFIFLQMHANNTCNL